MPMPPMEPMMIVSEILFTILSVIFCFLIYRKTKESYELTKYAGIKYFRESFLFFGLSYVLRFLLGLTFISSIAFDVFLPRGHFFLLFALPLSYFSTMGIFYLLFGTIWKRFDGKKMIIIGHTIAVLMCLVPVFTRSHALLSILQFALLIAAVVLSYTTHQGKLSKMKLLYVLVAVLWLINLFLLGKPHPMFLEAQLVLEVISLGVFYTIYYKLAKWVA